MTESIFEALTAIEVLESTANDVIDNPDALSVTSKGVSYSVIMATLEVSSNTHCHTGQVPVEAVCGKLTDWAYRVCKGITRVT